MRILLWHGYLLRGSGSNVYTANVARSWRKEGHDVLLMCQETNVDGLDFVDAVVAFEPSNDGFITEATDVQPTTGRCVVARPWIDGLLPVYVYDEYPGFTAKRFVDLTDEELDRYTAFNVEAMVTAIDIHRPEAIVTGHEVMGPYIAARARDRTGASFVAKLHGSALEYAVKVQSRYLDFAREGLCSATWVAGGSEYMVEAAASVIPGWRERGVVVNPGCDVDLFEPRPVDHQAPTIAFVGKLIAAKGVHHLLAALPLVNRVDLRAVIIGYGGFESELHALQAALVSADVDAALEIAQEGEAGIPLGDLEVFLASVRDDNRYWERARGLDVTFPGRLEHGPLAEVLPTFDALCVPSVVPEAFGMVAAEAAACAVLPIVPGHSGIGEVGRTLEEALGIEDMLVFDPTDPIRSLATRIEGLLDLPPERRRELGLGASRLARERWSWDHVSHKLLELASR